MPPDRAALSAEDFAAQVSVSRETLEHFRAYEALLRKWNARVNLVGPKTLADPWRRHFLDSATLAAHLPDGRRGQPPVILDLGSGAGFPGLVLSILGAGDVHLVESDQRKAVFLQEASRVTTANVTLHNTRLEDLAPFPVDVFTARAFAPLSRILAYMEPFNRSGLTGLLLKGEGVEVELTDASKEWSMTVERFANPSDSRGTILRLSNIEKRSNEA